MLPLKGEVIQVSWVVPDLDAAMAHWLAIGKTGPFLTVRNMLGKVEVENFYRKSPARIDVSIGLAQMGDVMLELIEQHTDAPSAYRDSVPAGQTGFHHIAMWAGDWDASYAALEAQGVVAAMEGSFGGARFAYFDTVAQIGCMLELTERNEGHQALYDQVRSVAQNWDGSDPIRTLL